MVLKDFDILGKDGQLNIVVDGYQAVIRMIRSWYLCGYVEVPKQISDIDVDNIICHGGITSQNAGIASFPTDGYYIGFDCAHNGDWTLADPSGAYRDINYVKKEIKKIVRQLEEIKNEH
ncbi:hypothetical protein [Streptococcus halichoeri]|uniref:hypothetical protein n=1 Tax=Streptococcus halichoeri TaxID=254785 RepID=UPI0013570AEF|nr:hypothetical protein [Streptococcus halichoeri]